MQIFLPLRKTNFRRNYSWQYVNIIWPWVYAQMESIDKFLFTDFFYFYISALWFGKWKVCFESMPQSWQTNNSCKRWWLSIPSNSRSWLKLKIVGQGPICRYRWRLLFVRLYLIFRTIHSENMRHWNSKKKSEEVLNTFSMPTYSENHKNMKKIEIPWWLLEDSAN